MHSRSDLHARLARRLALHGRLFDPAVEPRNLLPWLKPLQAWQARRLETSFSAFLRDPERRPAARFFLDEVYGDQDFRQRDADIARVVPMMQRVLPAALLETLADAIALAALSHAFDLRMAAALHALAPASHPLNVALYAQAYRRVGHPRLRARQIALIDAVGQGLSEAVRMPGVGALLRVSRLPARAAGLGTLQSFLERGFAAIVQLDDIGAFLAAIRGQETRVMQRLLAGQADPFRL
ncbi:FFLEELY motif protein [Thermomonas sp.]|uniref:FFLEELY motif protein n=1 Tax=Thermomonas sp. TaxID=1971895 RepID=UPI00391CEC7F